MDEAITCVSCLKGVTSFASLCDQCRYEVDESKGTLDASRLLVERTGCHLGTATWLVAESGLYEKRKMGPPTLHDLTNKIEAWSKPPVAIEAHWTKDSIAWWLVVSAALPRLGPRRSTEAPLKSKTLFVSAESERHRAAALCERVANYFRVPFWFPSPEKAMDGTPRWHSRHLATPCSLCGVTTLGGDPIADAELCDACRADASS